MSATCSSGWSRAASVKPWAVGLTAGVPGDLDVTHRAGGGHGRCRDECASDVVRQLVCVCPRRRHRSIAGAWRALRLHRELSFLPDKMRH